MNPQEQLATQSLSPSYHSGRLAIGIICLPAAWRHSSIGFLYHLQPSTMSTKDDAPPRYEDIVMPDWPRHSQFPAPQANAPSVAEHNGPPPPSVFKRTRYRINKLFSRLDSPWPAILMAMAITAGTTYLVARHVIRLRSEATVDGNSETWKSAARQHVYDPCYLGCADCKDPAYAWNACAQTFFVVGWSSPQGNVSVDCNANKMVCPLPVLYYPLFGRSGCLRLQLSAPGTCHCPPLSLQTEIID